MTVGGAPATTPVPAKKKAASLPRSLLLILAIALVSNLVMKLTIRPLDVTHPSIILGTSGYDIRPIKAPVVSGYALKFFSDLLTKTPLGLTARRFLLQDNGLYKIRELAAQLPDAPPLHFPMRRLNKSERETYDLDVELAKRDKTDVDSLVPFPAGKATTKTTTQLPSRVLDLHGRFLDGESTPTREVERVITSMKYLQPTYKMFSLPLGGPDGEPSSTMYDVAERLLREQAALSTKRYKEGKPLSVFDGVPVAFKDMIKIEGYAMTDGSAYKASLSKVTAKDEEDLIVRRFRALGAVVLPPTTMTEGGVTPVGFSVYPQGPYNPYSAEHYSGGSSGGSAAAVALGLAAVSVGYDGGGSIRLPASLSGVYGLATGFGRVPFESHTTSTNIKSGPFATTTMDVALAYAVMARKTEEATFYDELYDGNFAGVPTATLRTYFDDKSNDLKGVVIGVYSEWANDCDAEVKRLFNKALDELVERGATVKAITIPHMNHGRLAHALKLSTEFGLMWDGALSHPGSTKDLLEANTRITVGLGHAVTAVEALAADRLRGYFYDHVKAIYSTGGVDIIVTPTTSITAPKVGKGVKKYGESNTPITVELTKMIFLGNWLGLPGMSCPIGFDESNDNMPVGFQIMGDHWKEDTVLRVAKALEARHPWVPPKDFAR